MKLQGRKFISFSLPMGEFLKFREYCQKHNISMYRFYQNAVREAIASMENEEQTNEDGKDERKN